MTRYHQRDWKDRVGTLGDIAEGIFEEVSPLGSWERLGWNRPSFKMKNLSAFMRHMPDYACGTGHVVEVMGCGRDNTVKLKEVKYEALRDWNKHAAPVCLFLWNSHTSEWALLEWREIYNLMRRARREGQIQKFDDGNEFWALPWGWIEKVCPYDKA